MKYRPVLALLHLNLKSMPSMIWFQIIIALLMDIPFRFWAAGLGGSGFRTELSLATPLWLTMIAGMMYLLVRSETGMKGFAWMRYDEFLLTRPLLRTRGYFLFIAIYFAVILVPMGGGLVAATFRPDLKFSLYQGKKDQTEAVEKLELYRKAFPGSHVTSQPSALVIPYGNTFVAGWWLLLLTVLGVGMQWIALLPLPTKFKRWTPLGFVLPCLIPLYLMGSLKSDVMENGFLFFVRNWAWIAAAVLALFLTVQRYAWTRVQRMEVL